MPIVGVIFSALAKVGQSRLIFFINGGLALVIALLIMLVKLPRPETVKDSDDRTGLQYQQQVDK